jgi:HSP20 family protein
MTQNSENGKKGLQRHARGMMSPFEDMERWFGDFFPHGWMRPRWEFPSLPGFESPFEGRFPKVDVINRDEEVLVRAELPGVSKENLDVSMADNKLTISATTSSQHKDEKEEYYRREMSRGEFKRTLVIPDDVDAENVQANFKDGILELKMPKLQKAERRSITIE